MAVVATLTPTPVPANTQIGAVSTEVFHVKVTSAGGAGTYKFAHGLPYTPTWALVIADQAEGVDPSVSSLSDAAFCSADTDGTNLAINLAGNVTVHVLYG